MITAMIKIERIICRAGSRARRQRGQYAASISDDYAERLHAQVEELRRREPIERGRRRAAGRSRW